MIKKLGYFFKFRISTALLCVV